MGRPKKFNRDEVLEKAIPIFWQQGFADTSIQDMERATNVNKSGLYSEFAGKDDLYLACLRHYLDNRGRKKLLRVEPLGWDNIERFLNFDITVSGQKGCFAVNSMREFAVLPPEAMTMLRENWALVKQLLTNNIEAEQTTMDAEAIADIVLTFFFGYCLEQNLAVAGPSTQKIDDLMRIIRSL